MSLSSPRSVLYDENGNQIAVSQSQQISVSQSYLMLAGVGPTGSSVPITVSSDGRFFTSGTFSQSTYSSSSITSSFASTSTYNILLTNQNRKIATFYVEGRRNFFIGLGFAPSLTSFTTKLIPGAYYETPQYYTGPIWILSTNIDSTSYINVTELS